MAVGGESGEVDVVFGFKLGSGGGAIGGDGTGRPFGRGDGAAGPAKEGEGGGYRPPNPAGKQAVAGSGRCMPTPARRILSNYEQFEARVRSPGQPGRDTWMGGPGDHQPKAVPPTRFP